MTEQDKQALIKHFCFRDCGEAAKDCMIMPCHEIELIQEFPTTDTDSDTISRAKAIEALKQQAETMSEWSNRYAEQRKGILTAVNIVEDLPPAQPERTPMQELLDVTADRDYWKTQCHSYEMTINRLTESAQPRREERKIGEWIYDWGDWDFETCKCSECGNHTTTPIGERYSFCPNCGADMREVTT